MYVSYNLTLSWKIISSSCRKCYEEEQLKHLKALENLKLYVKSIPYIYVYIMYRVILKTILKSRNDFLKHPVGPEVTNSWEVSS